MVGEVDNDSTDMKGFTGSGRYLVYHQGGCFQIQKKLDAQTDATPQLIVQIKVTTKKLNLKTSCIKSASNSMLGCCTELKNPGFRYNA